MRYQIYRLEFHTGVHFGNGSLDSASPVICADSLFSALCLEALKENESVLDLLVKKAKNGEMVLSDTMPYIGEEYYLPRPMLPVQTGTNQGDSKEKKRYKKLQYIPSDFWEDYLKGMLPVSRTDDIKKLGVLYTRTMASVRGREETLPYRIKVFQFGKANGLYVIFGFKNEETKSLVDELMASLSLAGLGGKRSSGLGKFTCRIAKVPQKLLRMLDSESNTYMTLSAALPREEELTQAMENADYQLLRRGGFVSSENYSSEQMRKRDLYVFAAGSCFKYPFKGDVYDVADGGKHRVYRYAIPLFMGVMN